MSQCKTVLKEFYHRQQSHLSCDRLLREQRVTNFLYWLVDSKSF